MPQVLWGTVPGAGSLHERLNPPRMPSTGMKSGMRSRGDRAYASTSAARHLLSSGVSGACIA